jgi:hypothetical protein
LKNLHEILNDLEILNNVYLIEGIDIDVRNKKVGFNPNHEDNINTSIILNPTTNNINGMTVYSIFKRDRNDNHNYDGNPLIYALKGINGWEFINPKEDIINLLKQFIYITRKISLNYDTIMIVPSKNELNIKFLHRLNKIINSKNVITDYLEKLSSYEVYDEYIDWNKMYNDNPDEFEINERLLNRYFSDMENNNSGFFSFKFIKNPELRKYIKKTMKVNEIKTLDYSNFFNNKDVLVLDDTISSGKSISETTTLLSEMFIPKSITVITLFSNLK